MGILQRVIVVGIWALAAASWYQAARSRKRSDPQTGKRSDGAESEDGWPKNERVRITTERQGENRVVRFRGPLQDVMDTLHGRDPEEPPALPEDVDWRTLPRYYGGCPHCRKRSLYGESLWFYDVVERTREPGDYTTTYLARCRGCKGLMVARIDHED